MSAASIEGLKDRLEHANSLLRAVAEHCYDALDDAAGGRLHMDFRSSSNTVIIDIRSGAQVHYFEDSGHGGVIKSPGGEGLLHSLNNYVLFNEPVPLWKLSKNYEYGVASYDRCIDYEAFRRKIALNPALNVDRLTAKKFYPSLEALLPEIEAAQILYDEQKRVATTNRDYEIAAKRYNAVLKRAYEAVCVDSGKSVSRFSLYLIYWPIDPYSTMFNIHGNTFEFLRDATISGRLHRKDHKGAALEHIEWQVLADDVRAEMAVQMAPA